VIEDHIVIVERNDAWHLLVEGAEGGIFRQHRAINVDQHLLFFPSLGGALTQSAADTCGLNPGILLQLGGCYRCPTPCPLLIIRMRVAMRKESIWYTIFQLPPTRPIHIHRHLRLLRQHFSCR
jgi:hypothetical protein